MILRQRGERTDDTIRAAIQRFLIFYKLSKLIVRDEGSVNRKFPFPTAASRSCSSAFGDPAGTHVLTTRRARAAKRLPDRAATNGTG